MEIKKEYIVLKGHRKYRRRRYSAGRSVSTASCEAGRFGINSAMPMEKLDRAVDAVKEKFGEFAMQRGFDGDIFNPTAIAKKSDGEDL